MTSPTAEQTALAAAWIDFCDVLREAGETILRAEAPQQPDVCANGFLHLTQLLSLGIDFFCSNASGEFPEFDAVVTPRRTWALDNPDSVYHRAPLSGDHSYRITGQRGTSRLLLFDVNEGITGSGRTRRQHGHLTSDDMQIEEDGTFEIIISSERPPKGNWLPLDRVLSPFDFGLIVRQYFADRDREIPATYSIECLDGPDVPGPTSPDHVGRGLHETARFVRDSVAYWAWVTDELAKAPNQLLDADPQSSAHSGANPDNAYRGGMYQLDEGEALVIKVQPAPDAAFWNFYISDYWWININQRHHRMNINSSSATLEADGSLLLVVSDRDHGFGNHVDTGGSRQGVMLLRMTYPRSAPSIECSVRSADEIIV